MLKRVIHSFSEERTRWILWLPVFFGAGVVTYFSLKTEPDIYPVAICLLLSALLAFSLRRRAIMLPFLAVVIFSGGLLTAIIHARISATPIIDKNLSVIWLRGDIDEIVKIKGGNRLILSNLDLWQPETKRFAKNKTPKKVRVNVRTKIGDAKPGDRVSFRAILNPPPAKPVYPRSYDFARYAYFEQIGAVGYSLSAVKIIKPLFSSTPKPMEKIRHKITNIILSDLDNRESAHIATALLTGQKGGISNKILEPMRKAGLGHLLAISGLHMALVMAAIFFTARAFFALSQNITLKFNIKKWAAFIALGFGLFYLSITGMPVSARRAYIMAGLFFLAIILDRTGTPMRPIAWAALIVMFISPVAVVGPSFQMSFAAATALIATYENFTGFGIERTIITGNIGYRLKLYIAGVLLSSLVAGLATAPFAVYHFGRFANYGMIANLVAIPLTTFWILPFGIISVILMPLGLESMPLTFMEWGINLLTRYAAFISSLPYSAASLPDIPPFAIGFVTIGGLWLCIWQRKLRWLGIIAIIIGVLFIVFPSPTPDIIIGEKGKLYAVKDGEGNMVFSTLSKQRYARKQWLRASGQEQSHSIAKQFASNDKTNITCGDSSCIYNAHGYSVLFTKNGEDCPSADIIINLSHKECHKIENSAIVRYKISLPDLSKNGTYVIWLERPLKIENVESERGKRLWSEIQ